MKTIRNIILPVLGLLTLLLAVGVQGYGAWKKSQIEEVDHPPLAQAIPQSLNGWEVEDLPLGPTESVTEQSLKILNLDDYVYRQYSSALGRFSVYVAYWGPGKMPIRLVNQHTPDRCWTENGWSCTDRRFNVEKSVAGKDLLPAQWGEYEINGQANESYFWHIVDGEAYWFGGERQNTSTSITSVLLDLKNFTVGNDPEQYFVRIVSGQSLDKLWEHRGFQRVMADLKALCLASPTKDPEPSMASTDS
jgi:hypothetical protein